MATCPKCGKEVIGGAEYCGHCGTKLNDNSDGDNATSSVATTAADRCRNMPNGGVSVHERIKVGNVGNDCPIARNDVAVTFRNDSPEVLKYVFFDFAYFDRVGGRLYNPITRKEVLSYRAIGPIDPGKKEERIFEGWWDIPADSAKIIGMSVQYMDDSILHFGESEIVYKNLEAIESGCANIGCALIVCGAGLLAFLSMCAR